MSDLPLTCSAPFEEFPATADPGILFPELALPGQRPFEVAVTVPADSPEAFDGAERRTVMLLQVPAASAGAAVDMAVAACAGMRVFEVTVRPLPPAR